MRKWLNMVVVLALALSLFAGVFGYSIADAKSPKPQDSVKKFMSAAAGLKVAKAAGYWVTGEQDNVTSQLNGVAKGTKISLSKLKLVVSSQTTDMAEVSATYNIKIKVKGQATISKSNEQATFTLENVNSKWLISSSTIWSNEPWTASTSQTVTTTPPASEETVTQIFSNGNDGSVNNNPTNPTTFTLTDTCKITLIMDYHWNNGQGAGPGTIGLTDSGGKVIGTWPVTVRSGVYWDAKPNIAIGPGTYTVVDSDPSTWAQNNESNNQGMSIISGVRGTKSIAVASPTASTSDQEPLEKGDPDWWKKQPDLKKEDTAIHSAMSDFEKALAAKDVKQALTYFSPDVSDKYSKVLAESPDLMPQMAKDLELAKLSFLSLDTDFDLGRIAEYTLTKDGNTFYITFVKIDEKWLLESY